MSKKKKKKTLAKNKIKIAKLLSQLPTTRFKSKRVKKKKKKKDKVIKVNYEDANLFSSFLLVVGCMMFLRDHIQFKENNEIISNKYKSNKKKKKKKNQLNDNKTFFLPCN